MISVSIPVTTDKNWELGVWLFTAMDHNPNPNPLWSIVVDHNPNPNPMRSVVINSHTKDSVIKNYNNRKCSHWQWADMCHLTHYWTRKCLVLQQLTIAFKNNGKYFLLICKNYNFYNKLNSNNSTKIYYIDFLWSKHQKTPLVNNGRVIIHYF